MTDEPELEEFLRKAFAGEWRPQPAPIDLDADEGEDGEDER